MLKHKLFFILLLGALFSVQAQETWGLEKCIDYALQNNIQIKQTELQLQLNQINQERNLGAFLPTLNASASHGYNWGQTIDPFTNQFATERIRSNSFGIGTSMNIFNGFQNQINLQQGRTNLEVAQADLESMMNDVSLQVANAYLNVLFNQEFVRIAEANLDGTNEQLGRIQKLVDAGAAPRGNLYDIQSQAATDQASLISAENNLKLAKLSLTQLLQLSGNDANIQIESPAIDDLGGMSFPGSSTEVLAHATSNLPQMKSARAGVVSADQGVQLAKSGIYPNVSVSFNYGTGYSGNNRQPIGEPIFEGNTTIGFVDGTNEIVLSPSFGFDEFETKPFQDQLSDNINSSLFFRMTIPIFNGFNTKASVSQAKVQQLQATYALEQTEQQLVQDVERAYADALAAKNNYEASETSLNAAQTAFEYAEAQYEAGSINLADYTTSRIRRDNANADLIRNKYDYLFRVKVLEFYNGNQLTLNR